MYHEKQILSAFRLVNRSTILLPKWQTFWILLQLSCIMVTNIPQKVQKIKAPPSPERSLSSSGVQTAIWEGERGQNSSLNLGHSSSIRRHRQILLRPFLFNIKSSVMDEWNVSFITTQKFYWVVLKVYFSKESNKK